MPQPPILSGTDARPSIFVSVLREAGKPASLQMTKFDLPEAYGIVDTSYRTERMSHVRRYRLASASRACRRPPPEAAQPTNGAEPPPPPLRTVPTTAMHTAPRDVSRGPSASAKRQAAHTESPRLSSLLLDPHDEQRRAAQEVGTPREGVAAPFPQLLLSDEPFDASATIARDDDPGHHDHLSMSQQGRVDTSTNSSALVLAANSNALTTNAATTNPGIIGGTRGMVCLDPPEDIAVYLRQSRRALPLTATNVELLFPEPRDTLTGASLLKVRHQEMIRSWARHLLVAAPVNSHTTDVGGSSSPRQNRADPSQPSPRPSRSPQREALRRATLGAAVKRRSLHLQQGDEDTSLLLSDLSAIEAPPVSSPTSRHDASVFTKRTFQPPLDHLHAMDPMLALLQACHFQPSHFPRRSWLRLALSAELDLLTSAETLPAPVPSPPTAPLLSVSDPSFVHQRMLSLMLSEQERHYLRGARAIGRRGMEGAPSFNGQSFRSDPPTSPTSLTKRKMSDAAEMVKASLAAEQEEENSGSPIIGFANAVKRMVKSTYKKPKTESRVQLKMGSSPSACLRFDNTNHPLATSPSVRGLSKPSSTNVPNDLLPLPQDVVSDLPASVKHQITQQPTKGNGGIDGTTNQWNVVFQYWLDALHRATTGGQAVAAHRRLVSLHRTFIEHCGVFVERCLMSELLENVQVSVGGILFSLMPWNEGVGTTPKPAVSTPGPTFVFGGGDASTIFTSVADEGDWPSESPARRDLDPSSILSASVGEDDATNSAAADSNIEGVRKLASAHIRALNVVHQCWYKSHHPESANASPFANEEAMSLLVPSPHIASSDDVYRMLQGKKGAPRGASAVVEPRSTLFPLSCVVHHLGFVVSCVARLPQAVETSAAPLNRQPHVSSSLMATIGRELGTPSYVQSGGPVTPLEDSSYTRIDGSRHILYGKGSEPTVAAGGAAGQQPSSIARWYLVAAPTILPPLIPTMRYPGLRLRPEFTSKIPDGVPADVFSSSATHLSFPEKPAAQAVAVKVARKLFHKAVTDLVRSWEDAAEPLRGDAMCEAMQRRGINIALLGYIGDLLFTKFKSLASIANAGNSRPTSPSGSAAGTTREAPHSTEAVGQRLDALSKALATVKEEMAVRAFRVHWNESIRDICLTSSGEVKTAVLYYRTTELVKQLLGNESDPLVSTFWSTIITPHARTHFHFRAPLGRKDISLRNTLMRLESLCGIVLSPGTARDALNVSMLTKHKEVLSLDLRNTRAISIGSVIELRPYVKAPCPPGLPPLWQFPDIESARGTDVARYLEQEEQRSTEILGEHSEYVQHIQTRRLEVLLSQGEQNYELCESILLTSIVRDQRQVVPLYHHATEACLRLSRLYFLLHRNLDSARCADDAISVALAIPQSLYQPNVCMLFTSLYAAAKESGNREQVIHSLERGVVASVRRLEQLARDPYHLARTWASNAVAPKDATGVQATQPAKELTASATGATVGAFLTSTSSNSNSRGCGALTTMRAAAGGELNSSSASLLGAQAGAAVPDSEVAPQAFLCPLRRQILVEQTVLFNSIVALIEAYKAISYFTLDAPMSFHETVATPHFLQFLFELGCLKAGQPGSFSFPSDGKGPTVLPPQFATADIPAAKSIFARARHLAEILQLKTGGENSQVILRCNANFAAVKDL